MSEMISIEAARSTLRAAGSRALAQALIVGVEEVLEEGQPITQLVRIILARQAIMAYEEILIACDSLEVEVSLQSYRDGNITKS